jgi:hypothetical protein
MCKRLPFRLSQALWAFMRLLKCVYQLPTKAGGLSLRGA